MLKLRYLFENYDLARAGLAHWPHDTDSLETLLPQYRISSNAIYPFASGGEIFLLRLAPTGEKREQNIRAELAFTHYLREHDFPALAYVPSHQGRLLEIIEYNGETYFCTVSRRVLGTRMDQQTPTDASMTTYGETLARLHQLSAAYTPDPAPWSYRDVLQWMMSTLQTCGAPDTTLAEAHALAQALDKLPCTPATFGIVHYDYELDNVFYDEAGGRCHVIDFDDCMLHFFALDVEQALCNLDDELDPEHAAQAKACFLSGYRSVRDDYDDPALRGLLRRFVDLYGYARILRSVQDATESEPSWMVTLRESLKARLQSIENSFTTHR